MDSVLKLTWRVIRSFCGIFANYVDNFIMVSAETFREAFGPRETNAVLLSARQDFFDKLKKQHLLTKTGRRCFFCSNAPKCIS